MLRYIIATGTIVRSQGRWAGLCGSHVPVRRLRPHPSL